MDQENRRLEQAQRSIENEKRYLTVLEDAYEKLRNGARPESAMYVQGLSSNLHCECCYLMHDFYDREKAQVTMYDTAFAAWRKK